MMSVMHMIMGEVRVDVDFLKNVMSAGMMSMKLRVARWPLRIVLFGLDMF